MRYYPRVYSSKNSFAYNVGRGVSFGASLLLGQILAFVVLFLGLFALALWPITLPCFIIYLCTKKDKTNTLESETKEPEKELEKEPEVVNEESEKYKQGCIEK